MNTVVKGLISVVVFKIMLFSIATTAEQMTDLRNYGYQLSARNIEGALYVGMLVQSVQHYEVTYVTDSSGDNDSCANTAPQTLTLTRPDQIVALMNSMPIAEMRFTIEGYNDTALISSKVFLVKKSIEDGVVQSMYHVDYTSKQYSYAKSMVLDSQLGYYDRAYNVESYQVEYNLAGSTEVHLLTAKSLTELSKALDYLVVGKYDLHIKAIQDDGKNSNHFISFNKTQNDVVAENATLQIVWQAPATREDGSVLSNSDIAGYEIYYTSIAADNTTVDQLIEVSGADQSSYTMEDVPVGEYHFAVATIDSAGVKSQISDVITTVVN